MVDLRFVEGPVGGALVFGRVGNPPFVLQLTCALSPAMPILAGVLVAGALPVSLDVGLAAINSPLAASLVPALGGAVTLPRARPLLSIAYDNAVNRAPFCRASSPFERAVWLSQTFLLPHGARFGLPASERIGYRQATRCVASTSGEWSPMRRAFRPGLRILWGAGTPHGCAVLQRFSDLDRGVRPERVSAFESGAHLPLLAGDAWRELFRRARPAVLIPWGAGLQRVAVFDLPAGVGTAFRVSVRMPWDRGRHTPPGISPRPPKPPIIPGYAGDGSLIFRGGLGGPWLIFGRIPTPPGVVARVVIPILRSYLVVNDVTLIRVSNSLALPALTLSLSIDTDSWVWGWQASLPATVLDAVLPVAAGEPVELEASVNGVTFRLLAEKIARDRRFAQSRILVSGRGIAAALGAPYAAVVSRSNLVDRTAQQLAEEALMVNGIGIGWSIDWQLTDWLVPAGAWSHTGSHIEAVVRIAEAAGGYVQASRTSRSLAILPRYPVAPWDWSGVTPDYSLPSSATTREAVEWREKPSYNAVYIAGEGQGIVGHVTRAGTAGDLVAPMIVDALTTHADVARQRGLSILSDVGAQQILTLDTPVFAGVGIYPVGSFVTFSDGPESRLGIVRNVTVNAALPSVRQTVGVECHE